MSHILGAPTPEDQLNSTRSLTPTGRNLWQDQGVIGEGGGGISWVKEEEEEKGRTDTEQACCCRWHKLVLNRELDS